MELKLTAMAQQMPELEPTNDLILDKVFAMGKGNGEDSYSQNSEVQAAFNKMSLSSLNEGLQRVTLPSDGGSTVVVADLGSSSGPNTIDTVTLIIDKLRHRLAGKDVEFKACFNDLPSNDFNNLFQLLSNDSRVQNCYVAGVPGSYYHRLFPQSSVHVFFSSISLQWLSRLPHEVLEKDSCAYNPDRSWLVHSRSAVAKSFGQQASVDLNKFLMARASELVSGGLLFFWCLGRSTSEPNEPTTCVMNDMQMHTDEVWSDLVREGLLTEQVKETCNFPIYLRSIEEVKEAIASCSLFHVVTAKLERIDVSLNKLYGTSDIIALSRKIQNFFRAVFNDILEVEVGKETSAVFWQRFEKSFEKRITMSTEDIKFKGELCIVSLIRK